MRAAPFCGILFSAIAWCSVAAQDQPKEATRPASTKYFAVVKRACDTLLENTRNH